MKYGSQVEKLGYPSDGIFEFHGQSHILRGMALSLIYFYSSGDYLTERDKNILIYFALLHDIGRTDDEENHRHGKASVERIEREGIESMTLRQTEKTAGSSMRSYNTTADRTKKDMRLLLPAGKSIRQMSMFDC